MKGKGTIIRFLLQRQMLQLLHSNHMDIEKIRLLVTMLGEHEFRHERFHKVMCHMPGIIAGTITREDIAT